MGHRLSKIVTRTGDTGTTGLGDGSRVSKASPRIAAIGAVDELNSTLGVVLAEELPGAIAQCLVDVQHDLFDLGGELSIPGHDVIGEQHIARIEAAVEAFNAELTPLKEFILPGGTRAAALAHVARTVCRRAERILIEAAGSEPVSDRSRIYLNRLSDLLFVLARAINRRAATPDVLWQKQRARRARRPASYRMAGSGQPTDRSVRLAGLLSRIALGDQAAFGEFYELTSPHLYGVAVRILRDAPAAEELLQEAYISVWHHAGSYDPAKSQPLTWLTTIVRNRCLDQLRRREIDTVTITSEDDDAPTYDLPSETMTPVEMLLAGAEARSVKDCVETLDAGPKQAIALAFYQGLSHSELAAQLRQPLGTVKSWVRRGLERLKTCLDRAGYVRAE